MQIQERNGLRQFDGSSGRRCPTVREATFDDYDQIAAVQARNGLSPRPLQNWMALWRGNPAYEQHRGAWPIGWVLESERGDIVGSIGNVPRRYLWNGQAIRAATECDWAVDLEYRPYSLQLLQRITNQPDADLLLTTTVGPSAEPSYAAFRWCRVPSGRWDKAAFWITGYRGFLRSTFAKREIAFGALAIYPLAAALCCRDRMARAEFRTGSPLRIEERTDFDGRFDAFWEELQQRRTGKLLAMRSGAALRWQFQAFGHDAWIFTALRGERLIAYATFLRRDNPEIGLMRLRLIDFQFLETPAPALAEILARVMDRCRRAGIHMLEDVGCVLEGLGLPRGAAPYHRDLASWAYYYRAKRNDLCEALKEPSAWDPTGMDGDASL